MTESKRELREQIDTIMMDYELALEAFENDLPDTIEQRDESLGNIRSDIAQRFLLLIAQAKREAVE